jgi:hypothetical protein
MPASEVSPFPVVHVAHVDPRPKDQLWLIEPLWGRGACGVAGGAPKLGKTWLACELALAVATGAPALGRFPVAEQGTVIFYGAEDDDPSLRARFDGIARTRGVSLDDARLLLLDTDTLRLDRACDVARLRATVAEHRPALLVLDPFVRIAQIDENSAAEVSAVLGELRTIQRELGTAILLAHHMRKSASSHKGYQLRGSGDFAAWHDSALYLSGDTDDLSLHVEHRSAPAPDPLRLRLVKGESPHLEVTGVVRADTVPVEDTLQSAILERLAASPRPLSTAELRDTVRARKQSVTKALAALEGAGRVIRRDGGWVTA